MPFTATIAITSRNRKDELRLAIASALRQRGEHEVLVIDDASTDGTYEMLEREFPQVGRHRSEENLGLIEQRNRAAKLATGDIIVSLDDDAVFTDDCTVAKVLERFDHPQIGAVTMPYVDIFFGPAVKYQAPSDDGLWVGSVFPGGAHALRRDVFLRLGGYHGYMFRQGEETEYCQRMLNAGFVVCLGRTTPLIHKASPNRDGASNSAGVWMFYARNKVLYAWYNVPMACLPIHLIGASATCLVEAVPSGYARAGVQGLLRGYGSVFAQWSERKPVRWAAYRLFRELRKKGPLPYSAVERIVEDLGQRALV